MSKDPAILFYTADFLTATNTWKNEHVGMYCRLLFNQHILGHLTMEDMIDICKGPVPKRVLDKFVKDENGLYYNIVMDMRIDKRKKYSESRRNNRLGKNNDEKETNISESYVDDMSTHMENGNENININNKKEVINYNGMTLDQHLAFTQFILQYPNRYGEIAAKKIFLELIINQKKWDNLLLCLNNYEKTEHFRNGKILNLEKFMINHNDYREPDQNKNAANKAQDTKSQNRYNSPGIPDKLIEVEKNCIEKDCGKLFKTVHKLDRCPECGKKYVAKWINDFANKGKAVKNVNSG